MRHIIWDMGGTLINTYPEVVRALSRAAYGDTGPSHLREIGALTQYSNRPRHRVALGFT